MRNNPATQPRRYWDTDPFTRIVAKQENWEVCAAVLKQAERGLYKAYTSVITKVEMTRRRGDALPFEQRPVIESFFNNSFVQLVDVTDEIATSARQLCFELGLRPYDAVHVASAIYAKCDVLYTFDSHILRIRSQLDEIAIETPADRHSEQLELLDPTPEK